MRARRISGELSVLTTVGILFLVGLAGCAPAAVAPAAQAPPYGPPTYSVGDTWKRSNGLEIKVVRVGENEVHMAGFLRTCPTCIYQIDRNFTLLNVVQADGKAVDVTQHGFVPLGPGWKLWDFPLEVGKTWRISPQGFWRGSPARYTADIAVVAYEDVKTKAGTFKAYRIEQAWTTHGTWGDFSWSSTWWFAPDVKFSVKFTTTSPTGGSWELVSYSLK